MVMTNTTKRNIQGSIVCLVLSLLLGGIGVSIMMLREAWQSKKYGFAIERDDIVRYSVIGAIGSVVNIVILLLI
jgi:hypothetical protein